MTSNVSRGRSPLWNENSINPSQINGVVLIPEFSLPIVGRVAQSQKLLGAVCSLGDIERSLKNYSSLSPKNRKGLQDILGRVKQIIEKSKFACIEPRFIRISKDFKRIKNNDWPHLFKDTYFLEIEVFKPVKERAKETSDIYKELCDFFGSLDVLTLNEPRQSLLKTFEGIHCQITRSIEDSLRELSFVKMYLEDISNEQMSECQLGIINQDYQVAAEKVKRYVDFMSPEDQKKAIATLALVQTRVQSFEVRNSPNSIADDLGL